MVARRIQYIENHFDSAYRVKEWRKYLKLSEFKRASLEYAKVIKNSLQSDSESLRVLETLSCISWHNIRLFNDLLKQVHNQLGTKNSKWKYDEVLAALIVGQQEGQPSTIPNIFIPFQEVNQSYFLKLRILMFLLDPTKQNEKTHGIPIRRIIGFAQMYGYRASWITSALEESVRQRLIECIEIPSDSDEIVNFDINEGKTFKASPLGTLLANEIISKPIYHSLIATDLPFHTEEEFKRVQSVYEDIFACMDEKNKNSIVKDGIDIVANSDLPKHISSYLVQHYDFEKLPNDSSKSMSEIRYTEEKLIKFIKKINPQRNNKRASRLSSNPFQESLDLMFENSERSSFEPIAEEKIDDELISELIPENVEDVRYENSEFIPLIFTALVIRRFLGTENCQGVEITETINEFIVSEDNKKEPTNVSRALRSNKLTSQDWLVVRDDLHPKFNMFSLSPDWQVHWEKVFGSPPSF